MPETYSDEESNKNLGPQNIKTAKSLTDHEVQENKAQNNDPSERAAKLEKIQSSIELMQAQFTMKMASKHLLSQKTMSDILTFFEDIHDTKVELLIEQLNQTFLNDNNVTMKKVKENIKLTNNIAGN